MGPVFRIAIKSSEGKYLYHNSDGSLSFENCDIMEPEVQFYAPIGTSVFLQSYKRNLISLDSNNSLVLTGNNTSISENEIFSAVFIGANKVAVRASNGMFVHSGLLSACSNSISDNEIFEIIHLYI
ncbi:hypothetical protein LY28_00261 [Ruminiclostridium sufflavum DSM 19573]|uniref:Uncharacterized protein n=1 Tax=Ruminiclostridium sufflavum DSM 19573 TaxID=1121337 RepID=A0A318Y468_9FIRM|nr:hypothetical protein [Ruminiclostridium sufflavum]PYG90378.1 hypothetical protein LY28_00261 [Ruminiclostridium sufflavum DSM 19573]